MISKRCLVPAIGFTEFVRTADRVPVALEGAVLPGGLEIKRANLRGVESRGMLCSGAELHYGADASGLLILPPEWEVGEPFDYLLDVKVTPNRPDWLSHIGIAREIAALTSGKVAFPETIPCEQSETISEQTSITNERHWNYPINHRSLFCRSPT